MAEPLSILAAGRDAAVAGAGDPAPVLWRTARGASPPLADALVVGEALHVGILSSAGRHFGPAEIPPVLSGRGPDGRPLRGREQHAHKHVLPGSGDDESITHLALWAPAGLTAEERAVVATVFLQYRRRRVRLEPADDHPAFVRGRAWRSLTPYLPFNHVKPSGHNTVEGQVRRELVEFRGFPTPARVESEPWEQPGYRLLRTRGVEPGRPRLRPRSLHVVFPEPVSGPIPLGLHAHFGLGLLIPEA